MSERRALAVPPYPPEGPGCPDPFSLEALAAGEPAPESARAHVESGCAACAEHVASLRAARDAFLRARPAELFLGQLRRRQASHRRRWSLSLFAAAAVSVTAAAAAVLVVVRAPPDGVRAKGAHLKVVYRRADADPRPVTSASHVRPGDALRFWYAPPGPGYLAIFDVDGAGKITAFHPYGGEQAMQMPRAEPAWLPGSIILDAAPGPDTLVAVFQPRPFQLAPLAAALREHGPAGAEALGCGDCVVDVVRLEKDSP
ncbi:MAG TPA: hypothetical protein VND93_21335 [Myxococcales bacterium]|nr:hypothetical protein [Myxococcales bacterium]